MQLRGPNIPTRAGKCLGNANATFTAMICPLGTCRILSTTPYAPRPSSTMGSRSSAFTSKFCGREKQGCNRKFSSAQSLSRFRLFVTPWTAARLASLSFTISWSLLKLMSIKSVMPSNYLILCHLLLLPPSIFPSIRVFSNDSAFPIRSPKYWSFSFSISPSNEYSELISFRIDWLDLLAVQGTLKSLLQNHSSNASILGHSAFFVVQLSHLNMTTRKTIASTI